MLPQVLKQFQGSDKPMTINFNDSVDEDCASMDLVQNHLLKQAAEQPLREN